MKMFLQVLLVSECVCACGPDRFCARDAGVQERGGNLCLQLQVPLDLFSVAVRSLVSSRLAVFRSHDVCYLRAEVAKGQEPVKADFRKSYANPLIQQVVRVSVTVVRRCRLHHSSSSTTWSLCRMRRYSDTNAFVTIL